MRSAVVLAGGYSTRFRDSDKATAELDGAPLVHRIAECVAPAVDEILVNCREEQCEDIAAALAAVRHRLAVDPVPDGGPVAGIRTGCRIARGRWTFVVACDMPFVRAGLANRLFDAADGDGAVPRIDGRSRPLAAVYHTHAVVAAADRALHAGSGAVFDLLDTCRS
ncbi:molybdenum cofactor guanylyltransferase [Natrinema halophilum]|uniref:Molybdenum cofactor guanylyltransferase n=1 Tax=Natrinema halophilum TaxID=1699371 RepID=A0A7D5KZN9_9EURY|nr:molybdenum cofactor guanylyltransferase [Natrinema halophilum]QLG49700.1 molybdenum cofactor guanylyltransferase [Natrinema halophilum]